MRISWAHLASAVLLAVMLSSTSVWARDAVKPTADPANPATAARPNILLIYCDDLALRAISAYGSNLIKTPNIDRLAQQGMLFTHCLVTNSLCGPARATVLTGKYSHRNRYYANEHGESFDSSQTTFPKLLQQAGYQTAVVGKWHLVSDPTGFDYWHILPGQGVYYNPPMIEMGRKAPQQGHATDVVTDIALDWLRSKRDPARPFMLMYQHKAPHRQWDPALEDLPLLAGEKVPEPDTLFDDYANRSSAARHQEMTIAKDMRDSADLKLDYSPPTARPAQATKFRAAFAAENEAFEKANLQGDDLTRWRYQRYMKNYLRTVAGVDRNLGRVLQYLDESGLADNTVVVFSSDQGFYLGEHGWFDKRWMYEESLHTPLIVRWPGKVKPASVCDQMVSNLDFAETFLDIAGVPAPAEMQGRSMLPLLQGQSVPDWRQSFYYHYYEFPGPHSVAHHYGVRTATHKLIHYPQLNEWELFDLVKDPRELRSVHSDPAYAQVRKDLEAELRRLQKHYGDDQPDRPLLEILRK